MGKGGTNKLDSKGIEGANPQKKSNPPRIKNVAIAMKFTQHRPYVTAYTPVLRGLGGHTQ